MTIEAEVSISSPDAGTPRLPFGGAVPLLERLRHLLRGRGRSSALQRAAGGAFLIRVGGAAIAFLSQPLLARLMGSDEYGIYAYVWTWGLLFGGLVDCGFGTVAQRFIPEYRGSGAWGLLRGFLSGSRWLATLGSTLIAGLAALAIYVFAASFDEKTLIPMYMACATLPFAALCVTQDGIARSYGWIGVALMPLYIIRPVAIVGVMVAAHFAGIPASAVTIMAATVVAGIATTVWQTIVLNRRLRRQSLTAPAAYDLGRWISTSMPISVSVGAFYLLSYVDVLIVQIYRSPSDLAVYYAVQKLLAIVAFVHFSVAAAVAHQFSEHKTAGEWDRLASFYTTSRHWAFWPSLVGLAGLLVCGWPLLWLFGADFVVGYPLIPVLAIGLLARAAAGPAERLLTMVGRQKVCALVYTIALGTSIASCFLMIPRFGLMGAAMSTSLALLLESAMLFALARRELATVRLPV